MFFPPMKILDNWFFFFNSNILVFLFFLELGFFFFSSPWEIFHFIQDFKFVGIKLVMIFLLPKKKNFFILNIAFMPSLFNLQNFSRILFYYIFIPINLFFALLIFLFHCLFINFYSYLYFIWLNFKLLFYGFLYWMFNSQDQRWVLFSIIIWNIADLGKPEVTWQFLDPRHMYILQTHGFLMGNSLIEQLLVFTLNFLPLKIMEKKPCSLQFNLFIKWLCSPFILNTCYFQWSSRSCMPNYCSFGTQSPPWPWVQSQALFYVFILFWYMELFIFSSSCPFCFLSLFLLLLYPSVIWN